MKPNYKKILIILSLFFSIIGLIVGAIIFFQNDEKEKNNVITKAKLPDGYFDPRQIVIVQNEETPNKQNEQQEQSQSNPKNQPKQKEDFISSLTKEEVNYYELLRNKINYERLKNNSESLLLSKEELTKEQDKTQSKEDKTKDDFIYDKDFGIEKDEASRVVKLERVITADKMFPALLMTAVNSLLPGKVVAMIEDNIYGSHGKQILIPKGSTAIGTYAPIKKIGEERLAIQWVRILTPLGVNINLSNSLSADQMGRSGTVGELDNRYLERYGLPLAITTVSNALSYVAMDGTQTTATNTAENETSLKNEVIRDYKNDIGRVSDQVLKEQLNIKPQINIQAGTRIFISPILDIWFPEIKNNNIDVQIHKGEDK